MTQEVRWLERYNDVKSFIETNHRNPSKYYDGEKLMVHFLKRNRKLMNCRTSEGRVEACLGYPEREGGNAKSNAGELKEPRLGWFRELLVLTEKYKRVNQYQ